MAPDADAPPTPPSNTTAYVLVVVGIGVSAIMAIALISVMRPTQDNVPVITQIIGFAGATIAASLAFVKGLSNGAATEQVHLTLNSRLSEWREQTERDKQAAKDAADKAALEAKNAALTAAAAAKDVAEKMIVAVAKEPKK